jgi:hypothetical protein
MKGHTLVDCQGTGLAESLSAFCALEWLLFGMDVSVVSKMILPSESLSADITRVWPFICVGPLVDEEVVGFGEVTLAVFTDELLLWSAAPSGHPEPLLEASCKTRMVNHWEGWEEQWDLVCSCSCHEG